MDGNILNNLLAIVPLALWGCISLLMRTVANGVSREIQLYVWIAIVLMYVMFVFYYILLILYSKNHLTIKKNYIIYSFICLLSGTAFAVVSLMI